MKISVIIPTFKRPEHLARALLALGLQEQPADEIIVATRADDVETRALLESPPPGTPAFLSTVTEVPGVVATMQAAADSTTGDVVCLLDDDAEPPPDWIKKIAARFAEDGRLGVLGGRDLLRDHPEMRAAEPTTTRVGLFTWYGRFLGNHHRGCGPFRKVDTIKGCNAAVRGDLLRRLGFEQHLRGTGAQLHWEVALCLDAANAGYFTAYDPAIRVVHNIAPRHGEDQSHRGKFSPGGLYDMVWNEHFVVATRAGAAKSFAHFLWALMAGSKDAPGLLQYVRLIFRRDKIRRQRYQITLRAIWDARFRRGTTYESR